MPRFFERGDPAEREQRTLEAQLKGAVDRRVDNAVRLRTAEAKLAEARSNVEALALESDDAKLDAALQAKRSAEDKIAALNGAALKIGEEISDIEAAIDKVVDQRCRVETNAAVLAMAERVSKAHVAFNEAAQELEESTRESGLLVLEGRAMAEYTSKLRPEYATAVEVVVAALRGHARGVLSGNYAASLPRPAAKPVELKVVPQEPTLTLIATKKLKYTDASGAVIVCGAYNRHTFPQALGELALRTNVAVALNDKRARAFQAAGLATVGTPHEASCEWLSEPGREAPERSGKPGGPAAIHSSLTSFTPSGDGPFTVVDRGPPIVGTLPAQPLAVGQRNAEDDRS